jgi:hypothetical protein
MDRHNEADERWRAVFFELVRRAHEDSEFRTRVEATGAVIENFDAVLATHCSDHMSASGTIACREYWWGFQLEIPHERLTTWAADPDNEPADIAAAIETGIGPAAAFRRRLAAWIAGRVPELQQIDRGAGVYASMMWMAPNIFLATPIHLD